MESAERRGAPRSAAERRGAPGAPRSAAERRGAPRSAAERRGATRSDAEYVECRATQSTEVRPRYHRRQHLRQHRDLRQHRRLPQRLPQRAEQPVARRGLRPEGMSHGRNRGSLQWAGCLADGNGQDPTQSIPGPLPTCLARLLRRLMTPPALLRRRGRRRVLRADLQRRPAPPSPVVAEHLRGEHLQHRGGALRRRDGVGEFRAPRK
eukprot:gene4685-biopygen9604